MSAVVIDYYLEPHHGEPIQRGDVIGVQTGGLPLTTATRFYRCETCSGYFDVLDLAAVNDHEGPLPHPVGDQRQ